MTWNSDVNTVDINVLWSKQSFGGNWQLSQNNLTINVNDTCNISITQVFQGVPMPRQSIIILMLIWMMVLASLYRL